jgi:hypothetical protein
MSDDPRFDSWFDETHPGGKATWDLDDEDFEEEEE